MNRRKMLLLGAACALVKGNAAMARDYVRAPERPWRYVSDQVMGGISQGSATATADGIRLAGTVSTANRGGFIQARTELSTPLDARSEGLSLTVRGNGERYFLHLRTKGTLLPWQYYQAGFDTTRSWQDIELPFTAFAPSGRLLRGTPRPQDVTSIGLVAYGREHEAVVELRRLEVFP